MPPKKAHRREREPASEEEFDSGDAEAFDDGDSDASLTSSQAQAAMAQLPAALRARIQRDIDRQKRAAARRAG